MSITAKENTSFDRTILLIVTMASNFFNPLMGAAVNVALKRIGGDFSMTAIELSWVSMSYLLSAAVFLVPFGKIADIWSKTRIFLYGSIFFTLSTFVCGFAFSGSMLISLRFLQGVAAAMMTSTNMALVIAAFPQAERGKAIGLNVSAVYIGSSIAPMIGGFLTDAFTWRGIFYVNTIASLIISLLILWKIKHHEIVKSVEKFDIKGTILYMISISLFMYGLSSLPKMSAILMVIAGIAGLLLFVRIELKNSSPVLEIRLFTQNKEFAFSNLSALINYSATFGLSFILSLYLQYIKGLSARDAGLILIAQPITMAIVASFSGRMSDKINPRLLASTGMAISAIGLFILSFISFDTSDTYIIVGLLILGSGFGLFSSPNTNVVMSSVEKKNYGTASAILATMRSSGMMFSMAIATLSLHIMIGNNVIDTHNLPEFLTSAKIILYVFTALCLLGVFISFTKNKKSTQIVR